MKKLHAVLLIVSIICLVVGIIILILAKINLKNNVGISIMENLKSTVALVIVIASTMCLIFSAIVVRKYK